MSGINRLHGRTALQHDLCYHVFHDDSSSYGNSIFNTTYNFNGGMICWVVLAWGLELCSETC